MRVALKISYEGRPFHGFARQPDLRTVEGEVRFALAKSGLVGDLDLANVRASSRTDVGVSALGNVIAFNTEVPNTEAVGRFNDAVKDVWAWASASVPITFDPRRANGRWYRYYLLGKHDATVLRQASVPFLGMHDFASFASPDASRTRRHIDSIEIGEIQGGLTVDIRGPSFVRGMVRRIVAGMLAVERGEREIEDLARALRGVAPRDFGQAAAEPLFLIDVDIGVAFERTLDRATRQRIERLASQASLKARFWDECVRRAGLQG